MNVRERSKMAPTGIVEKENYYIIGDQYVRNFLVTALPQVFGLGMLSYYTSNPNIKVYVKTSPLKLDISTPLNKEYKEKEREWRKTKDIELKERLNTQLVGLQEYIRDLVANNDKTLNFTLVFSVRGNSKEELEESSAELKAELRMEGFKIETLSLQQLDLFKFTCPLFIDNDMSASLKYNIGVPITTKSFAGMWPYTFQTMKDDRGFLFAREKNNAGIILWDPLLYINDNKKAVLENRLTSNIAILGKTGYGKTTDAGLIIRYLIRKKMNIVWVDPENKNAYMTKKYGGTFIKWGAKGNQINIFDLKSISIDEEEEAVNPYDAELAIYNVIDEFKNVLRLYKPDINDDTLDVISDLVIAMYERFGITFDTDFRSLNYEDYPIMSDFDAQCQIEQEKLAKSSSVHTRQLQAIDDLRMKLKPMLREHKYYFDGHTTIQQKLEGRNMLSFGTRILFSKSKELMNALNYIMFSYIKALCLDENIPSATVFGETHMYLLEGLAASELAVIWRRSRKYMNCAILDTQEPADLNNDLIAIHGKAIMNNSTYKIIKHLEKDAIFSLSEVMTLTDTEKEAIETFERGDALFIAGKKHMMINVLATQKELEEIDPNAAS